MDPTVTESNMVHYLGVVEQQANSILKRYAEIRQALLQPSISAAQLSTDGDADDSPGSPQASPAKISTLTSVLGCGTKSSNGPRPPPCQPTQARRLSE